MNHECWMSDFFACKTFPEMKAGSSALAWWWILSFPWFDSGGNVCITTELVEEDPRAWGGTRRIMIS
jgi:hypothetical protein